MTKPQYEDYIVEEDPEEETDELEKDMLMRQSKLLYPDVPEWILDIAIKAHLNIEKLGENYKPDEEAGAKFRERYFKGTEYKTVF